MVIHLRPFVTDRAGLALIEVHTYRIGSQKWYSPADPGCQRFNEGAFGALWRPNTRASTSMRHTIPILPPHQNLHIIDISNAMVRSLGPRDAERVRIDRVDTKTLPNWATTKICLNSTVILPLGSSDAEYACFDRVETETPCRPQICGYTAVPTSQ
ncbi:hypothetical protein B0H14DRAFT_3168521, partial [Mycena olivaceomarginata]